MNAAKLTTVEVKNRSILLERIKWITEHTLTTTLQIPFLEQRRGETKNSCAQSVDVRFQSKIQAEEKELNLQLMTETN